MEPYCFLPLPLATSSFRFFPRSPNPLSPPRHKQGPQTSSLVPPRLLGFDFFVRCGFPSCLSTNFARFPNKFGYPCSTSGSLLGLHRVIYLGDGIPAHTYIAGVPFLVQAGSVSRGHIQLNLLRLVAPRDFVLGNVAASSLCPANAS